MIENCDRHALAGFRCVDAITSRSIVDPIQVMGSPLVLRRNSIGVFAVMDAPGVSRKATQSLTPPASTWPAPVSYEIRLEDPSQNYLPRRATLVAPQPLPPDVAPGATPTPAAPASPPLLTTPQQIVLYPGPAAALAPNWAVVRVSVLSTDTPPVGLPWAVIQVTGIPGTTPAGVTNRLGDALLAIPGLGLKLSSASTGSVTETLTPATVTVWFDPSVLKQPPDWVSNPDDILLNLSNTQWKTASKPVQLGPGQTAFVNFSISM